VVKRIGNAPQLLLNALLIQATTVRWAAVLAAVLAVEAVVLAGFAVIVMPVRVGKVPAAAPVE
jgi:hypothetical protein